MRRIAIFPRTSVALRVLFLFWLFTVQLLLARVVDAQNMLSVRDTSAAPGATGVMIPIDLVVDRNLTSLIADVTFDASLCDAIADKNGDGEIKGAVVGAFDSIVTGKDLIVRRTDLVKQSFQEQLFTCSEGKIHIAALDLSGNPVILAGSGQIATIEFDLKNAATGDFILAAANVQARLGPLTVSIPPKSGTLRIVGSPTCA